MLDLGIPGRRSWCYILVEYYVWICNDVWTTGYSDQPVLWTVKWRNGHQSLTTSIERKLFIAYDRVWSYLLGTKFLKYFESPVVDSAACSRATHFLAFPIHLYESVWQDCYKASHMSHSPSTLLIVVLVLAVITNWPFKNVKILSLISFILLNNSCTLFPWIFRLRARFLQTGFFHCEFRFSCFASAFSTFPC